MPPKRTKKRDCKHKFKTPKIQLRRSSRLSNKRINKTATITSIHTPSKIPKPKTIQPIKTPLRRSARIANKYKNIFNNQTSNNSHCNFLNLSSPAPQSISSTIINAPELQGKYKIIEKIDNGGYATVYKAIDLQSNNTVAIKRVHTVNLKTTYQNHPCIESQILEEFRSYPYFPTLRKLLVDNTSGTYSIIMDYFEHDAFNTYNNVLNEYDTIKYIYILLNCINLLCIKGYIHRDIKPGNFLYSHKLKKYLLIDFGLCQLRECIAKKYVNDIKLSNKYEIKNKLRRHSTIPNCKSQKRNKKSKRNRRSDVYSESLKQKCLPNHIRDGTPGFRAPEVVLASNNQDSRIDVFSAGLILGSIMLGGNVIFNPQNDYQQLVQYINIYGLHKVYETANLLNRKLEIRKLDRDKIYMNNGINCINSNSYVTGYELPKQQIHKYKLSYWIKERIKCSKNKEGYKYREWSNDLYDLLDILTEFNPFKRPTPQKALQHKLFSRLKGVRNLKSTNNS